MFRRQTDMQPSARDIEAVKAGILARGNVPRHVAIIMDGNGRWAQRQGLPRVAGHRAGVQSVRALVELCPHLGIEILTLYTFSTENWSRPRREISALMRLLVTTIRKEVEDLERNNVRVHILGHLSDLPAPAREGLEAAIGRTRQNTGLQLNLALSYSGRVEIVEAAQALARAVQEGRLHPEDITERVFASALSTNGLPDPDLLIRTSGALRLSNFLLWQLAYTEIYVTDTLWPDFRQMEFCQAILEYQGRERRFGKVSAQVSGRTRRATASNGRPLGSF